MDENKMNINTSVKNDNNYDVAIVTRKEKKKEEIKSATIKKSDLVWIIVLLALTASLTIAIYAYLYKKKKKREEDAKKASTLSASITTNSDRHGVLTIEGESFVNNHKSEEVKSRQRALNKIALNQQRALLNVGNLNLGYQPYLLTYDALSMPPLSAGLDSANDVLQSTRIDVRSASQASAAAGGAAAAPEQGSQPPITISVKTIMEKMCNPNIYDIDGSIQNGIYGCYQRCGVGFETLWYAPRDANGNPLKKKVPVLDPKTKAPILDEKGEPKTIEVNIPPTPWCRALCPIKMGSKFVWTEGVKPSSDILSFDTKPVMNGTSLVRTDSGENNAYCARSTYRRKILKGGNAFICGWCDVSQDTPSRKKATGNNRHNCESKSEHYGIDFTIWCQRRRLIPNLNDENLGGTQRGNNLDTPLCAAIEGEAGKKKKTTYVQGPKACRIGQLLPILSTAYIDTPISRNMVSPGTLLHTSPLILRDDQIVARIGGTAYSIFQYACYENCPVFMVPIGDQEDHLCAESCPPNTEPATSLGQYSQCKKSTYKKKAVFIFTPELLAGLLA